MVDLISALRDKYSEANLMNMLDPANASGWEAEGKRLAVNLPEVTVRDAAKFVAEMTPILGDAIAAKELWDMATSDNPNWPLIGAMGGATVIGLIPGIGDAAAKGIKAGARKMLDTAKRVEVDPNAMGSMLGNVRLKPKGDAGDVAKPTAAELRRQANIERFGYDPNEASALPSRVATKDAGFEKYLEQVNPGGKRIAAEDRPNLAMGDMYGMLPKKSDVVGSGNGVTFHRGSDGNYYATAFNPDVGEEDVVGYITNRGDGTELAVVQEMQGKGIGGELQYLFRNENPNAPTGGLTEAGEASLAKTYQRLDQEGLLTPSAAEQVSGFKAYHGSPHSFDKFSMDAIGTGEGAQHYGHGLYFAEAEPVAKVYRDQLSNMDTAAAQRVLDKFDGNLNKAILDTYKKFDRLEERFKAGAFEGSEKRYYAQMQLQYNKIMQLEQLAETGKFPTGSMYEVNIAANPENFIDYNAPLNKQTGKVAEYISNYEAMTGRPILDPLPDRDLTGEDLYSSIVGKEIKNTSGDFNYPSYKEGSVLASDYLKREGIPGIKYLDAGSRGTANATRNFVVFDENLINIVKKYGVAGAAVMLGVTAMDVEQAMAQGAQQPSGLLALLEMQKRANEEQQM